MVRALPTRRVSPKRHIWITRCASMARLVDEYLSINLRF
jgi:hypothetical protein